MMKKSKYLPLIIFVLLGLILLTEAIIHYNKPYFGKGEAESNLNIETYLAGNNQPTHPSVYAFEGPWNNYKYWMAYSPYPYSNGEEENPCLAVSNDLHIWETPSGLNNPIAFNEETGCDELKDPHIVYNYQTDSLEMWYLGRLNETITSGGDLMQMRKKSADGITWSDYETLTVVNGMLSPSIIYDDDMYKYWGIKPSGTTQNGHLLYMESKDGKNWSDIRECTFDGLPEIPQIWHGSVSRDSIYRFCFIETSNSSDEILYAESRDGLSWTAPTPIIKKGIIRKQFYRPHILASNDSLYCFYGTVDINNVWKVALSTGIEAKSLNSINVGDSKFRTFMSYYQSRVKIIFDKSLLLKIGLLSLLIAIILGFVPWFHTRIYLQIILNWLCSSFPFVIRMDISVGLVSLFLMLTMIISLLSTFASIGIQSEFSRRSNHS